VLLAVIRLMSGRIICLEGCSAAGKTTLARAVADRLDAALIPELDATGAPAPRDAEPWFTVKHIARFQAAEAGARRAGIAILDTDPLKGLWYGWMYADEGWPDVTVVGTYYRAAVLQGVLGFPDAYIYLDATAEQLELRRAGDATRSRRNFATHLQRRDLQRSYFAALHRAAPERVGFLATHDRDALPEEVARIIARLPPRRPDSLGLLEQMVAWISAQPRPSLAWAAIDSRAAT
jgi:hypothetical protein